jgi:transposase InsO family protein
MAIDNTYDLICQKYYWPKLFKELNNYVSTCVTCQKRNFKKIKPPLQETDIPPYPFAKIGLDLSGSYPTSLSGNTYIVSFIDLYSGWPEAFAVPDKSADQICNLLIDEIFPRHRQVLELCSDNGTENINYKVKETLEALNIHHVKSSYYHPQSNAKVERFHHTLHDILAKTN